MDMTRPHFVCKLQKALYGLKQAPRAWFARLGSKLQSFGFTPSRADTLLFIFRSGDTVLYVLAYVDDIIVTGSSTAAIQDLLCDLHDSFALKDLGDLHYFLGIEVQASADGLTISQTSYIHDCFSVLA
jgi:histone deacetylase 1/2